MKWIPPAKINQPLTPNPQTIHSENSHHYPPLLNRENPLNTNSNR